MIKNIHEFNEIFDAALGKDDLEYIIIESFTSLSELVLKYVNSKYHGYDIYARYADILVDIFDRSKASNKWVVFLGIDNIIENAQGEQVYQIKVEGKRLKGYPEKEFVVVLWSMALADDENKMHYWFLTNTDGTRPAKTPLDMYKDSLIPNDLLEVTQTITKYYGYK